LSIIVRLTSTKTSKRFQTFILDNITLFSEFKFFCCGSHQIFSVVNLFLPFWTNCWFEWFIRTFLSTFYNVKNRFIVLSICFLCINRLMVNLKEVPAFQIIFVWFNLKVNNVLASHRQFREWMNKKVRCYFYNLLIIHSYQINRSNIPKAKCLNFVDLVFDVNFLFC